MRTPSEAVVTEVLAAASRLLEHGGPEALTIRGIARDAGVAPMSVYNHFDGKDGVIDSLITEGFHRLRDELEAAGREPDPEAALREAGLLYRRLALDAPAIYRLMYQRPLEELASRSGVADAGAEAFAALVLLVHRVQFAHGISEDPTTAAQAIWSMVHGWVALELAGKVFAEDPERSFEQLIGAGLHLARTH